MIIVWLTLSCVDGLYIFDDISAEQIATDYVYYRRSTLHYLLNVDIDRITLVRLHLIRLHLVKSLTLISPIRPRSCSIKSAIDMVSTCELDGKLLGFTE